MTGERGQERGGIGRQAAMERRLTRRQAIHGPLVSSLAPWRSARKLPKRPSGEVDPEIAAVLEAELRRQQGTLEMIASENFVPQAVLEAVGSVLTNKYAEGYPGRRYYGGCEEVDVAEQLAIDRAKELFGAEHANVQAHAGAQANNAAYMALIEPGDTIMGLALDHGGHLTHGMKLNVSGKLYEIVAYHVSREDLRVDMEEVERLANEHRPKLIVAGWSAYPRQLDFAAFREIADSVGAKLMVDMAHFAGLVAAGEHPNPVPARRRRHDDDPQDPLRTAQRHDPLPRGAREGDRQSDLPRPAGRAADAHDRRQGGGAADRRHRAVPRPPAADDRQRAGASRPGSKRTACRSSPAAPTSTSCSSTSPRAVSTARPPRHRLEEVGITVNRNAIPFDERPPMNPSGLRIGTPALTTRGLVEEDMTEIAVGRSPRRSPATSRPRRRRSPSAPGR